MEFFLYSHKLAELDGVGPVSMWLREEFDQYGYSALTIEVLEGGRNGDFIHVSLPDVFRSGLNLELGSNPPYLNTAYCVSYLGLPEEVRDTIRDIEWRLNIRVDSADPKHLEDCVDYVAVLSQIEEACFFGPQEYYVRKIAAAEKNVTKNWVSKQILSAVSGAMQDQGFAANGLRFEAADGRVLEFEFMTKSNYEYALCTRGSFQVVVSQGINRGIVPAVDNNSIRYVEPDAQTSKIKFQSCAKHLRKLMTHGGTGSPELVFSKIDCRGSNVYRGHVD